MCVFLCVDDLLQAVDFEENAYGEHIEIEMLKLENDDSNTDSNNFPFLLYTHLFSEKRGAFYCFIAGFMVAVIPRYCKYPLFDLHSKKSVWCNDS